MTQQQQNLRFAFGRNWARFLSVLNDDRIEIAEKSLRELLGLSTLNGMRLLDAGSGSGLFSLAARRLGAEVVSFDFDRHSVACTAELRSRFFDNDAHWQVLQGSVLDAEFLRSLGQFDVVYSWGVLHHTGAMQEAFENIAASVAPNGLLAISIYNDQGAWSRRWAMIKRTYNRLPAALRPLFFAAVMIPRELRYLCMDTLALRPGRYFRNIRQYSKTSLRGMSYWHDLVDWIGGYPFETATPEAVFEEFCRRGFQLERLRTVGGGSGCNEFTFRRVSTETLSDVGEERAVTSEPECE